MTTIAIGLTIFVALHIVKQALLTIAAVVLLLINLARQSATFAAVLMSAVTFAMGYLSAR